jgi:hypothetical protein
MYHHKVFNKEKLFTHAYVIGEWDDDDDGGG